MGCGHPALWGSMAAVNDSGRPPAETGATLVDAVRAFTVVFGGSVVLAGAAGASLVSVGRVLAHGRRPPAWSAAGAGVTALYVAVARPWMRSWGATAAEKQRALPGDDPVPGHASQSTRAVTIAAAPTGVWPWLAQIGQDRGGFYSYEWLENLAGCRMRNAGRIHPEWQDRQVGETVLLHWANGLELTRFEPPTVLALQGWGSFVLEPVDEGTTRLLARSRQAHGPAGWLYAVLMELPHFIMERRMLLGIKERAEAPAAGAGS